MRRSSTNDKPPIVLAIDFEFKQLPLQGNVIWSLTWSYDGKRATTISNPNGLTRKEFPKDLIRDLESEKVLKIVHNAIVEGSILLYFFKIRIRNVWCTMNVETIIQGVALPKIKKKNRYPEEERLFKKHGVALDYVLPRYGLGELDKVIREGFVDRPIGIAFTKKELRYMVDDVLPLIKLQRMQEYILRRDDLMAVALLENAYVEKRILAKVRGLGFDRKIWRHVATTNKREFDRRISLLPIDVENWNSEKQVKAYFRRSFNIDIPTYKSNDPNVDDLDSLYLKTRNPILGDFILARELHKSATSYGLNWFEPNDKGFYYIDNDDRIRADVTQIIETGRTSMNNPNLQQLPGFGRKDYEHEKVLEILYKLSGNVKAKPQHRRAFVPSKGNIFGIGDFSGQELGIMAAASQEKLWLDTMLRGDDVHSMTASILYAAEWDKGFAKGCSFPKKCSCPNHVTPRERAKILNFMLAYGGGATRFSKATGLSILDSKITIARYKRIIPNLTRYLDRNGRNALNTGESYSADPYRRRRVLRGETEGRIINQGKNNPIQAAGANMLKLAAISIPDKYYCPLEIHDEIILDVPKAQGKEAIVMLKSVMERSADYITGIKGLIKVKPKLSMNIMKD